jgi:hypothetical protein
LSSGWYSRDLKAIFCAQAICKQSAPISQSNGLTVVLSVDSR